METPTLTEWDARERAGLLALETPEWRKKREIAEAPEITADVLHRFFTDDLFCGWSSYESEILRQRLLLIEAVAAHPNLAPHRVTSTWLIDPWRHFENPTDSDIARAAHGARGICRNPAAPLWGLALPDIWGSNQVISCEKLLREETLPPTVAKQLVRFSYQKKGIAAYSAGLHIAVAGEISGRDEGRRNLTDFWRTFCREENHSPSERYAASHQHAKLVEWGLAPAWAKEKLGDTQPAKHPPLSSAYCGARRVVTRLTVRPFFRFLNLLRLLSENKPLFAPYASRDEFLGAIGRNPWDGTAFVLFAANLLRPLGRKNPPH